MFNNRAVLDTFNVDSALVDDIDIPVLAGIQRQGDVLVIPHRAGAGPSGQVPGDGVPVVRGESGGNTHLLVDMSPLAGQGTEQPIMWRPVSGRSGQDLGELTVPEGSVAGLLHPEHGATLIGPGYYIIRRQREQADEIRLVAD